MISAASRTWLPLLPGRAPLEGGSTSLRTDIDKASCLGPPHAIVGLPLVQAGLPFWKGRHPFCRRRLFCGHTPFTAEALNVTDLNDLQAVAAAVRPVRMRVAPRNFESNSRAIQRPGLGELAAREQPWLRTPVRVAGR